MAKDLAHDTNFALRRVHALVPFHDMDTIGYWFVMIAIKKPANKSSGNIHHSGQCLQDLHLSLKVHGMCIPTLDWLKVFPATSKFFTRLTMALLQTTVSHLAQ